MSASVGVFLSGSIWRRFGFGGARFEEQNKTVLGSRLLTSSRAFQYASRETSIAPAA